MLIIELWKYPPEVIDEGIRLFEALPDLVEDVPGLQNEDDLMDLEGFVKEQIRNVVNNPGDVSSSHDRDDAHHILHFGVNEHLFNYLKSSGKFAKIVKAVPRHFVKSA